MTDSIRPERPRSGCAAKPQSRDEAKLGSEKVCQIWPQEPRKTYRKARPPGHGTTIRASTGAAEPVNFDSTRSPFNNAARFGMVSTAEPRAADTLGPASVWTTRIDPPASLRRRTTAVRRDGSTPATRRSYV